MSSALQGNSSYPSNEKRDSLCITAQDSSTIKVFCRFRPLNEAENERGDETCVQIIEKNTVRIQSQLLEFVFDRVFSLEENRQEDLFQEAAVPIIQSVLEGYNGTIFAYGQTSAGKTYTMQGLDIENEDLRGIIPRTVKSIFSGISEADENIEFTVKVSMLEIYMERIHDLLDMAKQNLRIHEDRTRGIWVGELTEIPVREETEIFDFMKLGNANRKTAETLMNQDSSRSHSIFIISITQFNTVDLSQKSGKLFLVDLAGSEKVNKTGAQGQTLEEAKTINKSLSALGNVINALTDGKSTHIPYRDSKLTRILQESLGGNSRTALVICCSPSTYNESETVSTLRFGARAKKIRNKPRVNQERSTKELKLLLTHAEKMIVVLQERISTLEQELSQFKAIQNNSQSNTSPSNPSIKENFLLSSHPVSPRYLQRAASTSHVAHSQISKEKPMISPSALRPSSNPTQNARAQRARPASTTRMRTNKTPETVTSRALPVAHSAKRIPNRRLSLGETPQTIREDGEKNSISHLLHGAMHDPQRQASICDSPESLKADVSEIDNLGSVVLSTVSRSDEQNTLLELLLAQQRIEELQDQLDTERKSREDAEEELQDNLRQFDSLKQENMELINVNERAKSLEERIEEMRVHIEKAEDEAQEEHRNCHLLAAKCASLQEELDLVRSQFTGSTSLESPATYSLDSEHSLHEIETQVPNTFASNQMDETVDPQAQLAFCQQAREFDQDVCDKSNFPSPLDSVESGVTRQTSKDKK